MKHFILYIAILVVTSLFVLECTTRLFDLSNDSIPEANVNGDRLITPGAENEWIGGGFREIVGHYKINPQGFNSIKDYSSIDKNKLNIAIIGDSFIEGFHVDVNNSIGRILEHEMQQEVNVHEYGKSAGNIADFSQMYLSFVKNKYDYTFILVAEADLYEKTAFNMGKGESARKPSTLRNIYSHLSSIKYLNINKGLSVNIKNAITFKSPEKKDKNLNETALNQLDSSVIILYEKEKLNPNILDEYNLTLAEVKHKQQPINFGFDKHWNHNGRKNCAITIKNILKNKIAQNNNN